MSQKTLYQVLAEEGHFPEDLLGEKIITVYKSVNGFLGVGLFRNILAVQDEKEIYMPVRVITLECEMLSLTPECLLAGIIVLYHMAKESEISLETNKKEGGVD